MQLISNMIEAHIFREGKSGIEFLLLKRSESEIYPGIWQMVSGKIKAGEKAFETALREIKEETGLTPVKLWAAPNINSFYQADKDYISFLPVFAALVNPDDEVTISKEHSEFKWVEIEEAKKILAWEGQRKSVDIIKEYYLNEKYFLNFVEIKL